MQNLKLEYEFIFRQTSEGETRSKFTELHYLPTNKSDVITRVSTNRI